MKTLTQGQLDTLRAVMAYAGTNGFASAASVTAFPENVAALAGLELVRVYALGNQTVRMTAAGIAALRDGVTIKAPTPAQLRFVLAIEERFAEDGERRVRYTERRTARGLAAAGLAVVERWDGSWMLTYTDAGRAVLSAAQANPPGTPRLTELQKAYLQRLYKEGPADQFRLGARERTFMAMRRRGYVSVSMTDDLKLMVTITAAGIAAL